MLRSVKTILQKRPFTAGLILLFLLTLTFGIVIVQKIIADPKVSFLFPEQGADWIRFSEPIDPKARDPQTLVSIFRTHFEVNEIPREAILSFRAMKRANVLLDHHVLYRADSNLNEWKKVYQVDLAPALSPGSHELRIEVLNQNGHPALLTYCKQLKLFTGEHWESSKDGTTWTKALSINKTRPSFEMSREFQRADRALFSQLPVFLSIFIVVFFCSLLSTQRNRPHWLARIIPTAKGIRWAMLVAWVLLAINNIGKISLCYGMDISGHIEYVLYVVNNMSLPLATDGWTMFQPPLFYMISAVIYNFFLNFFSLETVYRILRVVPLLCGAVQIMLCHRALRYVYPQREDLQILGTVVGGLIPMNLYISQVVGNEPMAGCLTGVVVVLAFRFFCSPSLKSKSNFILMGFFLGLALLTKITAVLLVPSLLCFIAYTIFANSRSIERPIVHIIQRIAVVLGIAFFISSWYYFRNFIELGYFFIGGWNPSTGFVWWQDPGYRIIQQFCTFGETLYYPINSAIVGVWDSLYSTMWMDGALSGAVSDSRPPWNYPFLLSNVWLSLLPAAAIFLGVVVSLRKSARPFQRGIHFAASCIIIYVLAILYMFFTLPVYSTAKATYTLGLIPCYAVLCARGLDLLTRRPFLRATIYGVIACWAVSVYLSFFVLHHSSEEVYVKDQVFLGEIFKRQGKIDETIDRYTEVLRIKPGYAEIHNNLGTTLLRKGKAEEAIVHLREALRIKPDSADIYINLGSALFYKGKIDEAVAHYQEALRIKPDSADIYINLGVALFYKGEIDKAVAHYQEALRIKPGHNLARNYLKKALESQKE